MKPAIIFLLLCFGFGLLLGTLGLSCKRGENAKPAAQSQIDIGFAQAMAAHHSQAITMAQLMLDGRPTRLQLLARNMAYTQLYELGEMHGWLKLWSEPLHVQPLRMDWMRLGDQPPDAELQQYLIDCSNSPTGMPGLAEMAELEKLRSLEGLARDEHFLNLMLAHHEGGIPMARFASSNANLLAVRNLARNIVIEQSKETNTIKRTLIAMKFAAGHAGNEKLKTQANSESGGKP